MKRKWWIRRKMYLNIDWIECQCYGCQNKTRFSCWLHLRLIELFSTAYLISLCSMASQQYTKYLDCELSRNKCYCCIWSILFHYLVVVVYCCGCSCFSSTIFHLRPLPPCIFLSFVHSLSLGICDMMMTRMFCSSTIWAIIWIC